MMTIENEANQISNSFYVLKALAIICVASAHCPSFQTPFAESIRALLGSLGVPCFLICSGYYFKRDEETKVFWLKKLKTIIIPWIIWGIVTFMIPILSGSEKLSFAALVRWILGYGTWLYFVPVLLVCFALFRVVKSKVWDYCTIILFFLSWTLTYLNILGVGKYMTSFQNPFNFIAFFSLGMIIRHTGKIKDFSEANTCLKIGVSILWIFIGVLYATFGKGIGYWQSLFSIPFELLSFSVLFWVAYAFRNSNLLKNIGKRTYFIYFLHMQIGNMIVNSVFKMLKIESGYYESVLAIIKPCLVVLVIYLLWFVTKKVCEKLKINNITKYLSI